MKKRLTVNTLAAGNLKMRKKQYGIIIFSIIFAITFASMTVLYIFSAIDTVKENNLVQNGKQDFIISADVAEDGFKPVYDTGYFEQYGFAHIIGYAYPSQKQRVMGSAVAWLDDSAAELAYLKFESGAYPTADGEIAIERKTAARLGLGDVKVGDTVTLCFDVQNGFDDFAKTEKKSYKITGILKDKTRGGDDDTAIDETMPHIFVAKNTAVDVGGRERLNAYFRLKNDGKSKKETLNFYNTLDKIYGTANYQYLNTMKFTPSLLDASDLNTNDLPLYVICGAFILAACIGIAGSFSTNLKDRRRQIGLLRAVGTTRRQIINIFGREALLIALICIPPSIAVAYAGVWAFLKITKLQISLTGSLYVLPICAAAGLVIVMLSALLPLIRAARISPMQAIRDIDVVRKMKKKHIKSKESFAVPKLIAKRNLTFRRGTHIAVSAMLIIVIVITNFGFGVFAVNSDLNYSYPVDYVVQKYYDADNNYINSAFGITQADMQEIVSAPYISSYSTAKSIRIYQQIDNYTDYYKIEGSTFAYDYYADSAKYYNDPEGYKKAAFSDFSQEYKNKLKNYDISKNIFSTSLTAYDNDSLAASLKELGVADKVDFSRLDSAEDIILIAPEKNSYWVQLDDNGDSYGDYTVRGDKDETETGKNSYKLMEGKRSVKEGDKITLDCISYKDADEEQSNPQNCIKTEKTVTVSAIIDYDDLRALIDDDKNEYYLSEYMYGSEYRFVTTMAGLDKFYSYADYNYIGLNAEADVTAEINKAVTEVLDPIAEKYNIDVMNEYEIQQKNIKDTQLILACVIVVIVLSFVIGAGIINNSLAAQIRENRREIGTLRAFGAAQRDLVNSFVYQLLVMFAWGMGIGYGAYCAVYCIFGFVQGFDKIITLELWQSALFCALLFAVCSVNLLAKVHAELKNSVIENIRWE